jgi:hypothetical protein
LIGALCEISCKLKEEEIAQTGVMFACDSLEGFLVGHQVSSDIGYHDTLPIRETCSSTAP